MSLFNFNLSRVRFLSSTISITFDNFPSIPNIFCTFFLVMAVCGCLIVPPFQTADEYNHFLRSVQISEGHFTGERHGSQSGGKVSEGALRVTGLFQDLPFDLSRKASIVELNSFNTISWNSLKTDAYFPNTVIYGPLLYMPSATALFVSRHLAWSVLQSYYLARFANTLTFLLLGIATLVIARRGKVLLCFLLSLPMTVSLAMSVSQDSLLIATSALLASILTTHRKEARWSYVEWAAIGLGFGLLGMAKPPYVILSGIACLMNGRREFFQSLTCALLAFMVTLLWLRFGVAPVRVHFAPYTDVSETAQSLFVLHHPMAFLEAVVSTIASQWTNLTDQMIGLLGWLNVRLPKYYYNTARYAIEVLVSGGIFLRLIAELVECNFWYLTKLLLFVVLWLLSAVAIFLSLYLIWTRVAAPVVDGLQGRYFLPMTFFLAVLMPDLNALKIPIVRAFIERSCSVFCIGWMSLATFVFFQAVILRYWLP